MNKQHEGQIEECKSIFPTWIWMIGFILSGFGVVCGCVYVYATDRSDQISVNKDIEIRIERLEKSVATVERIEVKVDTLIKRGD